jgi:spore maturation protein SpmA
VLWASWCKVTFFCAATACFSKWCLHVWLVGCNMAALFGLLRVARLCGLLERLLWLLAPCVCLVGYLTDCPVVGCLGGGLLGNCLVLGCSGWLLGWLWVAWPVAGDGLLWWCLPGCEMHSRLWAA